MDADDRPAQETPGVRFTEGFIEADDFRIRYLEAGEGTPLIHLHGGGGLRLTPAHDLLSQRFRVIAFEMPGFGQSAENTRTRTMPALADTMAQAITNLGIDRFNLLGTSFGGKVALWMAVQQPERVLALVLESPAAIRPENARPPASSTEELARQLYAHPERIGPLPVPNLAVREQSQRLTLRLVGPNRDAELENRLGEVETPTLVLLGTADSLIPPEMGHIYKETMSNCHLVFVYDAAHAISVDRPEAFAEVVLDFLDRHEAFIISRRETAIFP